ncbi:beta-ketoacyl-[acyl-carrier-protein] synthase family protein [Maridesulfovibrio hydrothermalis]|uniref:Beta-ketoacyl synthase II n=1 Tax=Maridesulfovibrio hydrothermalis AM13 = DSM 14728 TaxID=1121451 RepID=L0R9K3_9BACT|nr:beta-ketoacyl-[acyl-carrier-protein] synthase family protein [Maridesulfovibrio hydrothermalis]CCO23419.1 Beta-ketoacyl synthase II [Maridesulfovibrio hydrothermalis AM13 = DSM 14728]
MDNPVGICATGSICAAGKSSRSCFATMLDGQVTPSFIPGFSYDDHMQSPVFAVPKSWLNEYESTTPLTETVKLLFTAADEAYAQAGLDPQKTQGLTIGTCIGSSTGASLNFKSFYQEWKEGQKPDLKAINSYLHCNPAQALAEKYSFSGPVQTVTNACSSGTDAVGMAASWIRQGLCDIVFAGGADALSGISYTGFSRLMITSPQPCRPFDKNRSGLNLGEGAAVLILTSEKAQRKLGLTPIARILGYGTACDAHHLTAPHPDGMGLKKAIQIALERSGLNAKDIGFINVHGTGTQNNDCVEGMIIKEFFENTPFTGIKGFTGHTLGAAGAIEAVMTALSLQSGLLMPASGFNEPDPETGVSPINRKMKIRADYALSDSLAFGGNNSAIILQRETT